MRPGTVRLARWIAVAWLAVLAACAGFLFPEPVQVSVVGMEPITGEGMEARFLLKLRVQNPNDRPVDFDGVSVELDVRGMRLASGVSDARGSVPRFGEQVITVPVSVPMTAVLRQLLGLANDASRLDGLKVDYTLRGRLAGSGMGGVPFSARGELAMPGSRTAP
jgi:LEA14-like dessication related protein